MKAYPQGRTNLSAFSLDKRNATLIENFVAIKNNVSNHAKLREDLASSKIKS